MGKVAKSIKRGLQEAVTHARISTRPWSEEVAYQIRTDKKFAELLVQKLIRDGEHPEDAIRQIAKISQTPVPKRVMKNEHFRDLLQSIRQMGNYLRGKKVPGIKTTSRPKSAAVAKRRPKSSK